MGCARTAVAGFSPLDEELQLLPGSLSPGLQECLVRLGAWMPFEKATGLLEAFTHVSVSEFTARQISEVAGAAQVDVQTAEVERLEREAPLAPPGPVKQLMSADGAFVPLVGGQWAEVKTLVIGEVTEPVLDAKRGEQVVHTRNLSYFSRLANADSFARLALGETHRRGVENAGHVGAVLDGAEWLQGFVTWHRPDAGRILDFPHAASYVSKIGQATFGAESPAWVAWRKTQLHRLKHEGPEGVLAQLRDMVLEHPAAEILELPATLAYLEKRATQMQYPTFQAQGWPIGSGAVESGNKLVVEARLKGAGMHWARDHVDPMLALRNIVCNDRWAEAWPQIETRLREQARQRRAARRQQRRPVTCSKSVGPVAEVTPSPPTGTPLPRAQAVPMVPAIAAAPPSHRPAPNHPWRHSPIGRARFRPARAQPAGKL